MTDAKSTASTSHANSVANHTIAILDLIVVAQQFHVIKAPNS